MNDTPTQIPPKLVLLVECARRSCSHIHTEEERVETPKRSGVSAVTCPACYCDTYYVLKPTGQRATYRELDKYRSINPAGIEPAPRTGPKKKASLLAAKRRALGLPAVPKPVPPISFNVNSWVHVKLNERGRQIYVDHHATPGRVVTPPSIDADGFTGFQLWSLMEIYGPHLSIGMDPPFETTIRLIPE